MTQEHQTLDEFDHGQMREAIQNIRTSQEELRRELSLIHADMLEMKIAYAQAKGGWKAMIWIGGVVFSLVTYLAANWHSFFGGK